MSKADLKAAMESLQVRNPLRLPTRQPQFVAPTQVAEPAEVAGATQVPMETPVVAQTQVVPTTQVVEATLVPTPTQVAPQVLVSAPTLVDEPAPVANPTRVSAETPIATPAPVAPGTQVTPQTQVGIDEEYPPKASDQDSSVTLEALAAPKLHNGYTRLPNNVLMRMAAGELVRSEIQVLLLIARFTISFQRRHAPLSKTVLERQSGLRGPAVLQAISALLAKGLIEKIPGDQHRPNQLGLVFTEEWDFFPKGAGNGKNPVEPATQVAPRTEVPAEIPIASTTPDSTATSAQVAAATPAGVPESTDFKDIKTKRNNNSLSQLPSEILTYLEKIKPPGKRARETECYRQLASAYGFDEISAALQFVRERGIPGSGEACHSPMAFLARGMTEVLTEIGRADAVAAIAAEKERLRQHAEAQKRAEAARQQEDWERKERDFHAEFKTSESQEAAIREWAARIPWKLSNPEVTRSLAICGWWEAKQKELDDLTSSQAFSS